MDLIYETVGPSTLTGMALQAVFLWTLLGTIPVAVAGILLARSTARLGRGARLWTAVAWAGSAFQAVGILSSAFVLSGFVAEVAVLGAPTDLFSIAVFVGLLIAASANLVVGVAGLSSWRRVIRRVAGNVAGD